MSGIRFRSLLEISDLNSWFKTGSNCRSIVDCSANGRPILQYFGSNEIATDRFKFSSGGCRWQNVSLRRDRTFVIHVGWGAGGLAYRYHCSFYFFLVFIPRLEVLHYSTTQIFIPLIALFFFLNFPVHTTQLQRKVITANNGSTINSIVVVVVCVTANKKSTNDM